MTRYDWPSDPTVSLDDANAREAHTGRLAGPPVDIAARAHRNTLLAELAEALPKAPSRTRRGRAKDPPGADTNLWLPIGPSTVVNGQAEGDPRVAGRVRDLWVSAGGGRAYAATASGGVWFSGDRGTTWAPLGGWAVSPGRSALTEAVNTLACGCLLVISGAAPDGSDDTVYVGTGEIRRERSATPGGKLRGIGVLRLTTPVPAAVADPFGNPWTPEAANLVGHGIYRLAHHPTDQGHLVAATSAGLFSRAASGAAWHKVTVGPFDFEADDEEWVTDVAWAPAGNGAPARLWVALEDHTAGSDTGVWVSENGPAGPFDKVSLDGIKEHGRLALAVAPSDNTVVFVLGRGPRLWRITGVTADRVKPLPAKLFGGDPGQSAYDMAVAVHPTQPNTVVCGGSVMDSEASLFRFTVSAVSGGLASGLSNQAHPHLDPTFIGRGVHADVHALRYTETVTPELWVGCDGGVFRSAQAGDQNTFVPRNTGLATLECGYVANHPTASQYVLAGTQDNGVLHRIGDTVWEPLAGGDGGGVAHHPSLRAVICQFTNAHWRGRGSGSVHFENPVWRNSMYSDPKETIDSSEKAEANASSFYSGIAVVESGGNVRVAIGTNRVWYSETWGQPTMTWKTLPSDVDPRRCASPTAPRNCARDNERDVFDGGAVIALRWAKFNRLVVLQERAVAVMEQSASGWQRHVICDYEPKCTTDVDNDDIEQPTSPHLPPLGSWSDLAIHDPNHGPWGSVYVATTGHGEYDDDTFVPSTRMDTLWWFDGTDTWHPTELRTKPSGIKVPAYAVVCDPDDVGVVYVGTSLGVWRGSLVFTNGMPDWTWEIFSNGLPEAAVQDLSFHRPPGGPKLLRAAVQARGVWEVDLSGGATSTGRSYLRVHAHDDRRMAPANLGNPQTGNNEPWNASPDVRIRCAPGSAAPAPASLSWAGGSPDDYELWVFQTALHAIDLRCRPTGQWTAQFSRCVRDARANLGLANAGAAVVDAALWNAVVQPPHVFSAPWDGSEPTEADLLELIVERPVVDSGMPSPREVDRQPHLVDVLVHHRHLRPVPATEVKVTLLMRELTPPEGDGQGVTLSGTWRTQVAQLMAFAALPAGWTLSGGWDVVDPLRTRAPAQPVDARTPRVVTFEFDAGPLAVGSRWLLLAIVASSTDPVTATGLNFPTVQELVLSSHHVAARRVSIIA
jgi:hypothetical protein